VLALKIPWPITTPIHLGALTQAQVSSMHPQETTSLINDFCLLNDMHHPMKLQASSAQSEISPK